MTTHDAIKHLSYKIAYAKRSDEKWVDCIHIEALEIAVRAMAEERKKGKWIYHNGLSESRECSCCHVWFDWDMPRNSYCPNCGADMREDTDDAEIH